jgi:hypothetical protein
MPKLILFALAVGVLLVTTVSADSGTIPFYTGNLSVHTFMRHYGTAKGPQPPHDWASPEHIAQLKRIGVFADCDYLAWSIAEPTEGEWDFSPYVRNADLLHAAGLKYSIFCWVHFPPQWYIDSPDFVPYQCAEHGEKLVQLSPWSPNVWRVYHSFYSALSAAMGDKIDWIRVATPSDYGEIGYPAAMTSWLVPQKHAHQGYWCGDPYARADFQAEIKARFKTLQALNGRWGTGFKSWDAVAYPDLIDERGAKAAQESGKATDRRRWLDFIDWYNGTWLRFTPRLVDLIRQALPGRQMVVSVGYASEDNKFGNDYSAVPRMASKIGVALQTPGNVGYYAMKRVSTACHFYGVPYYTEPPGDVPPDAEIARIFADVSNGVQVYFEYPNNIDRALARVQECRKHMTGAKPVVDLAIFNATLKHRLTGGGGFPQYASAFGEQVHERLDFDVVDETLIEDGILSKYRVLVYIQGGMTEASTLRKIAEWVKKGGALVTCDIGDVESVEGDKSVWVSLMPPTGVKLDAVRSQENVWDWQKLARLCCKRVGKGIVVKLPLKQGDKELLSEAVSHVSLNLSDFGTGLKNGILIDGEVDGLSAVLLPDRILYFTWLDKEVTRKMVFRPEDWAGRSKKPEKMVYDLRVAPHSIEAIMLK